LKADYKSATGNDWQPGAAPAAAKSGGGAPQDGELGAKVAAQGDLVRQLKADKKPKEEIDTAVKALLALKVEYKNATGSDWQPAGGGGHAKKQDKKKEKKEAPKVED
jgi:bifunctional glutamyl/prolyl-tRNA synthetase